MYRGGYAGCLWCDVIMFAKKVNSSIPNPDLGGGNDLSQVGWTSVAMNTCTKSKFPRISGTGYPVISLSLSVVVVSEAVAA